MSVVTDLHAEYLRAAHTFTPTATPRLSWKTVDAVPGWLQEAAVIRLTRGETVTEHRLVGASSVWVAWPFEPLREYEPVRVQVAVVGPDGQSAFCAPIVVELAPGVGAARMIGTADADRTTPQRFVRDIESPPVRRAVLSITSRGVYQARIDGVVVGAEFLAPGWSAYDDRLLVQTHDVTALLSAPGGHRLVVDLAAGWYAETFGYFARGSQVYTEPTAVVANLHLELADGETLDIGTDDSWTSVATPFRSAGIYAGEHFDARLELPVAHRYGASVEKIAATIATPVDADVLRPASAPPITRQDVLRPVSVQRSGEAFVLDFGQNIAGHVRLRVRGESGTELTFRHAEVMEGAVIATRPLRTAAATDVYVMTGDDVETWQPTFTYHGFRYVEVSGWPDDHPELGVEAVVCGSDLQRTGRWRSSHGGVDKLHENVVWSARGNFFSVPTDCTQRDERLGWTGDIAAFAPAGSYLFDMSGFLASWLEDLAIEQARHGGNTPLIIPSVLPSFASPVAGWGDATTMVPSTVWEFFGDAESIRRQFASMRAWVDCVLEHANDDGTWTKGGQIGDHLDPTAPPDRPTEAKAAPEVVASAYLAHSLRLVAQAASLLGETDVAERYGRLAERSAQGFRDRFVTPRGLIVSDAQTTYALALAFDLVPDERVRHNLGRRLAQLVRENRYRVGTGFLGTPYLLEALLRTGNVATASRLLLQDSIPSWLYPVSMGATTVWERWDSLRPDGSLNPGEMLSFNHYALGAVVSSLYSSVAGLRPAEAGWRTIGFEPHIVDGFDWVDAEVDTPYGVARARWERTGDQATVRVSVPANARAWITLPGSAPRQPLVSGEHEFRIPVASRVVSAWVWGRGPAPAPPGDDERALEAVLTAVRATSASHADLLENHTRWREGVTLDEALLFAPPEVTTAIDAALERVNAQR